MHIRKRSALATFAAATIFLCSISPVIAQSASPSAALSRTPTPRPTLAIGEIPLGGIRMTISPVFINITTNPGVPIKTSFKVTNNNNFKEYYNLSLIKFRADSSGANISPIEIDSTDEFTKWISFSETQFSLEANEVKKIDFSISPPQSAALGYYYGIRVGRVRENSNPTSPVLTGSAILPLLMEVRSPNAKKELSIIDFSTSEPFYEYVPAQFNIKVRNSGNIHSIPFGDIFIDQGKNKDISVLQANKERSNVLPQTERVYTAQWLDGFPARVPKMNNGNVVTDKNGKTVYETKWDLSKIANFRIGKYTANLVMVYDNGKEDVPLDATVSFWIIPWKILLVALLVVVFVLFGIKSIISSIFRRK